MNKQWDFLILQALASPGENLAACATSDPAAWLHHSVTSSAFWCIYLRFDGNYLYSLLKTWLGSAFCWLALISMIDWFMNSLEQWLQIVTIKIMTSIMFTFTSDSVTIHYIIKTTLNQKQYSGPHTQPTHLHVQNAKSQAFYIVCCGQR